MSCANYYKILAVKVFPGESGGVKRWVLLAGVVSLPSLAVGLVGFRWFTRPQEPHLAARMWVWRAGAELHARAFVGAFPQGQPPEPMDVVLELRAPNGTLERRARTSHNGVVDFSVPMDRTFKSIALKTNDGNVPPLVTGAIQYLDVGAWITTQPSIVMRPEPPLGDLSVRLPSGVLAVPFLAHLYIEHGEAECFFRLYGAELAAGSCCDLGCAVYPSEHIVELELGHSPSRVGTVLLPLVPGAMAVNVVDEKVFVFSATPRPVAHLAWITDIELLKAELVELSPHVVAASESLPMAPVGTRLHVGATTIPPAASSRLGQQRLWLVTSSEADFIAAATVAWPLGDVTAGHVAVFSPRVDDVTLDGFSAITVQQRERKRASVEQLLYQLVFLLLLETGLLVVYVRKLGAETMGLPLARRSASFGVVIACLVFAFAGLLGLFWWRI